MPVVHTVQKGEHLWSIANKYFESGYNWVDIAETNGLGSGDLISAGQQLSIPDVPIRTAEGVTGKERVVTQEVKVSASITGEKHVVEKGDTLWIVSVRMYGDGNQWPKIFDANSDKLTDPNMIEVGQELNIPQ